MAETLTANYAWTKPDPGASANTWGATLNATTDKIDTQVHVNQQGMAPVGAVTMFAGATAPANWLICNGASLSTAAPYDKLFAVLQYAFGGSGANFNLPNLSGTFPLGAGASNPVGQAAGSFSVPIAVGNLPPHAHPITDVAHNHTINQNAHNHGDPGHVHPATGSQDAHAHGIPLDLVNPSASGLTSGGATFGLASGQATDVRQPNVYVSVQSQYTGIQANTIPISLNPSGTNLLTTQNVGSGAPLSVVPKFVALNFIVRYI